jgi:hypothetical protein
MLIVDCPSVAHVASLARQICELTTGETSSLGRTHQFDLIVHMSDERVVHSDEYRCAYVARPRTTLRTWTSYFAAATDHLYLNESSSAITPLAGVSNIQQTLNQLHPRWYPLLANDECKGGFGLGEVH